MQAAVDFALKSQPLLRTPSRKRNASSDGEQDKDPSWIPSDSKPKRKRSRNTHAPAPPVPLPLEALQLEQPPLQCTPAHEGDIEVKLDNSELWERFSSIETEMVICKNGRRMFPAVEISIKGLKPTHIYSLYISVELYDNYRYRYRVEKEEWDKFVVRGTQVVLPHRVIPHPDSHNTGAHFMKKPLSFKTIKMTNNRNTTREDQLILQSMRRYYPIVTIKCHSTGEESVHPFYDCKFIAVTSYQKPQVTLLKIAENGFAAAFRKNPCPEAPNSEVDPNQSPLEEEEEEEETERAEVSRSRTRSRATPPSCSLNDNRQLNTSPLPSTSLDSNNENYYDDEDDELYPDPSLFPDYSDVPAHLRPVLFQPQHYLGLHTFTYTTLAYEANALTIHKNCNEAPSRGNGAADQNTWWSEDVQFADNVDGNPELDLIYDFGL